MENNNKNITIHEINENIYKNAKNFADEIIAAKKIALFHHIKPDGDTISCSYGLLLAIKSKYPEKEVVFVTEKSLMDSTFKFLNIPEKVMVSEIDNTYLAIIGDTSVQSRVHNFEQFEKGYRKLCFDHHENQLDFKVDLFWKENKWVASAMQANYIVEALHVKLNEETALFLAIGLLTDSGNFVYSTNDPKPVELYAKLLKHISPEKIQWFFKSLHSKTMKSFQINASIMSRVNFSEKVSYAYLEKEFVEEAGGISFTSSHVSTVGNIENFPIWAMFSENPDAKDEFIVNVDLRSNGPDIVSIATKYHGGGHALAAGCRIKDKTELQSILKDLDDVAKDYQKTNSSK